MHDKMPKKEGQLKHTMCIKGTEDKRMKLRKNTTKGHPAPTLYNQASSN